MILFLFFYIFANDLLVFAIKIICVVEIYRKFVWYHGLACRREKGKIGCWGREDLGDSSESFSHAFARTLLVAWNDPPTHSCWRSVVDDNGNPIFRNNICLEDRRLTLRDAARRVCTYICACVCVRALYAVLYSYRDVFSFIF